MPPETLEVYRRQLLKLKAQLRGDVDSILRSTLSHRSNDGSRMPIHMAELGSEATAVESNLRVSAAEQERLALIDAALLRIESGTYGICTATGRRISRDRLNAVPFAEFCIEYARQLEGQ